MKTVNQFKNDLEQIFEKATKEKAHEATVSNIVNAFPEMQQYKNLIKTEVDTKSGKINASFDGVPEDLAKKVVAFFSK